ncbi:hypothetical protein MBLNU459_g5143t1 [Dothideomycetes sp. NU459]
MAQYQQDELAQLFARNMNFTQPLPQHPVTPDRQFHTDAQPVYASQHYIPSAYLRPSESPFRSDSAMGGAVENIDSTLIQHDINPAALSPSQTKLFTNADYEQRLRLLELWRISPPENDELVRLSGGVWPSTSIAQEEELARIRYERRIYEREQQSMGNGREIGMDGDQDAACDASTSEVEPYIVSGYAHSQRYDPVYAAGAGLWKAPNGAADAVHAMETRYGAFSQARNFEQLQSMNREVEGQRRVVGGLSGHLDDDMVM